MRICHFACEGKLFFTNNQSHVLIVISIFSVELRKINIESAYTNWA